MRDDNSATFYHQRLKYRLTIFSAWAVQFISRSLNMSLKSTKNKSKFALEPVI